MNYHCIQGYTKTRIARRQSWAIRLVKCYHSVWTPGTTQIEGPYQGYQYPLNCTYVAMSKKSLGFECSWKVIGWTLWSFGWHLYFARVADLKRPLMGTVQERQGVIPLPASRPSQAIVDVSENMRTKLYSMFCKLGECLQLIWRCRPCRFDLVCLEVFVYS